MASFELTSPDNIAKPINGSPASIVQVGQTLGDSVQATLSKRERYDFVWANSTERTAQTGMVEGSRGYQLDTKSEYIYDNSNWRLATPYAEFSASLGSVGDTPPAAEQPIGVLSIIPTQSTDQTFIVPQASGILRVVRPGIYALSAVTDIGAPVTGRTFLQVTMGSTNLQRLSVVNSETVGSLAVPNVFVTAANTDLSFKYYKQTGGNSIVTSTVRIARTG